MRGGMGERKKKSLDEIGVFLWFLWVFYEREAKRKGKWGEGEEMRIIAEKLCYCSSMIESWLKVKWKEEFLYGILFFFFFFEKEIIISIIILFCNKFLVKWTIWYVSIQWYMYNMKEKMIYLKFKFNSFKSFLLNNCFHCKREKKLCR